MAEQLELNDSVNQPTDNGGYDKLTTLTPREHIRLRPGMYIGKLGDGTHDDDGIYVILKEVLDNSIDEYAMGYGKQIDVTITDEGEVTVRDYGRGIPLDKVFDVSSKMNTSGKYALAKTPKAHPTNGLTYSGYAQVFMADNDQNPEAMKEIILPIRQDGKSTKCYSGANYLVSSMRIVGMPYMGTTNGWSCNYARPNLIQKFFPAENIPMSSEKAPDGATEEEIIKLDAQDGSDTKSILAAAGDDRALFYAGRGGGIRKLHVEKMANFLDGISIVKWQNIRTDGGTTNDVEFPDTDIPLLRYAEAFMTRAEAKWRLGDNEAALKDINTLRARANAKALTNLTEQDVIDEWCREFYMEGRRRSDLNRFDMFVGKKYIWDWKGGVAKGQSVDSHFKFYPIPIDDINGNPNMAEHQNAGY